MRQGRFVLMLVVLLSLLVVSAPTHAQGQKPGTDPVTQIVGGTEAVPRSWPWQAGLYYNGYYFCGGTLISNQWVVTAAHCVVDATMTSLQVRLGDHDIGVVETYEVNRSVTQLTLHPSYNDMTTDNDIALLKLSTPVTFNVAVAKVPGVIASESLIPAGTNATATGWGALYEGGPYATRLQQVVLPILSRTNCTNLYRGYNFTTNMICAGYLQGGRDACQGDSGGPLVVKTGTSPASWRLAGITSWGVGCARAGYPGVYTNATKYITWIEAQTGVDVTP